MRPAQCIETHLKDKTFDDTKVAGWVNSICEDAMYGLIELGKPFKYIGMAALTVFLFLLNLFSCVSMSVPGRVSQYHVL